MALLFSGRIRENRSTAILTVLVALSLFCLASDTRASIVRDSLYTVVSTVTHPVWVVLNSTRRACDYTVGLVVDYNKARTEVQSLRKEMANLVIHSSERAELAAENARLREMLAFVRSEPALSLVPAHVLATRLDGTLLLDVGTRYGIEKGMGVITKDGVVGIVAQAEPFQSVVFTVVHPQCKISAIVERNRIASWVQGSGSDLRELCDLVYLDMKDEVKTNDVVVTNSGSRFPRGIPIGVVERVEKGALLKAATVRPLASPYRVEEVFVVCQAQPNPADLAGPVVKRTSAAPQMPDTRTEQEKFAP